MGKKKTWSPRRVRSEEERGSGSSDFIMLDEGEKFLGYALFTGDPAEDEPGYYEFLQHWNNAAKRSIPCAGEDCPFCEDGDKPKDVANTLWLVTKDEKGNTLDPPQLRIFKANSLVIKQLTEKRSEDDPIKGVLFRVSRLDDRGNYVLEAKGKKLSAKEVKEALKDPGAPNFDQMVTSQLNRAMEGIMVARALDDDDDDDDEDEDEAPAKKKKGGKSASKSKGGKKKPEPDDDDGDDDEEEDEEEEAESDGSWPEGLDGVTVTVKKTDKDGNFITVEHDDYEGTVNVYTNDDIEFDLTDLSKGDEVTVSATGPDDDGDYILSDEPTTGEASSDDDDEDEDEDEASDDDEAETNLPDAIEDEEFVVESIDTTESTMEVSSEELGLSFTLYFLDKGPASEVDFDDYKEGTKIILSAEQDSQGDMVATTVPEIVKKKSAAKKKDSGKKGGKAKGGKKKK